MGVALSLSKDHPAYQALLLGAVCAVVSLLLIAGNLNTTQKIATLRQQDKLNLLAQVLPTRLYDNQPLQETLTLSSDRLLAPATLMLARKDGKLTAVAMQLTVAGWGGPLQMLLAVTPEGELLGVRIISHKETPGLTDGIEAEKSNWINGFNGKSLQNPTEDGWAVKKDGGEFDQFTGATITPRAVVHGVYQGLLLFQQWQQTQADKETQV